MEVKFNEEELPFPQQVDKNEIINFLTENKTISFKSQQRGEHDLSKQEKIEIASDLYESSKLKFLIKFGNFLLPSHLNFFQQFTENNDESLEIKIVLNDCLKYVMKDRHVRNRRYQALKRLVAEESYFSEVEMMKREPLLYHQLIGQYLTEREREERDKIDINEQSTLVKVLLEGIERDDAHLKQKLQEKDEDAAMEEELSDSVLEGQLQNTSKNWGEFFNEPNVTTSKKAKTIAITEDEQILLRNEFISVMYENFLSGRDDDFDYDSVDNNEKYDNNEDINNDAEEKYFDSEEAEMVYDSTENQESEDELDIYMSGLDEHPGISQISKDLQHL